MAASNGKIYADEQDQALLDGRSKLKPSSASHEHEPLPLIQGHQYSTRSGSRVEALKAGQVGYFAATVLNDLGNGNVRVRFDDFAKDEEIALSDTRALIERRSYPDIKFRLDPNNVDEFEHQVFYRALRRGKAGLKFIEFNKTHGEEIKALTKIEIKKTEVKTEVSITSDGVIREAIAKFIANDGSGVVNSGSAEEKFAAQDLFAEILEMCPYQDFLRYQLQGSYDEIGTSLQLFYCARNAALYRRATRDALANELHSEHGCFACKQSSFTVFDGVREMLQGNYILESWRQAPDAADAYNDVVALNQNLGLIAALILTIAIPQGLNANGITDQSESTYIGCELLAQNDCALPSPHPLTNPPHHPPTHPRK